MNVLPIPSEIVGFVNQMLLWAAALLVPIGVGYVAKKILPEVVAYYQAHTNESDRRLLELIVAQVVKAAEESRLKAAIEGTVFNAFEYAISQIKTQLSAYGWGEIAIDTIVGMVKAEIQKQLASDANAGVLPVVTVGTNDGARNISDGQSTPNRELHARLWA